MNAIIIDDERLARRELKSLLEKHTEINVVAECQNAEEGIKAIEDLQPDLVMLDIQMPGKNGFEMLEELSFVPKVVFTTAYDEFAIKAFKVSAFDYLLKPIDQQHLDDTIAKLLESENHNIRKGEVGEGSKLSKRLGPEDQVFVKDGNKCWFVKLKEVSLFESEGNYVRVYFKNFKPLILKSLNNLEEKLDPQIYFRANRKHIINLEWVEKIENWFNGGLRVELKNGKLVEISRRQAAKLKDRMSL